MRIKKYSTLFIVLFTIGMISIGFSSWIINAESIETNLDTNVGNIQTKDSITSFGNPSSFEIYEEGIKGDGVSVPERGIIYTFRINNTLFDSNINTIIYKCEIRFGGNSSTIGPFFKNIVVDGITYEKSTTFPTKQEGSVEIYIQENVVVNLNKELNYTEFTTTVNFVGNFYNIITKKLIVNVSLEETGIN